MQLAALAEHELRLVHADAVEELDAVDRQRTVLLDALESGPPGRLSDDDRDVLQYAMRTQQLAAEAMRQRRDQLAVQLGHSDRARRAAAGYAAGTRA